MAAVPPSVAKRSNIPSGGWLSHNSWSIIPHEHFRIFQDTIGNRILITNDTFRPFVYKLIHYNQALGQQMVPSMPRNFQVAISYTL